MPFYRPWNTISAEDDPKISGASSNMDDAGSLTASPNAALFAQAQPSGAGGNQSTGSGFQNLDKYLQNNNAKAFGQQVTGNVSNEINTAKANQDQAASTFQDQVNSTNVIPTHSQVDDAVSAAGNPELAAGRVTPNPAPTYLTTPTQAAPPANPSPAAASQATPTNPTPVDPTTFQGWLNNTYTGPKNLADNQTAWNQYWSGTNKANTSAQLLNSEPGRFSLLDSYFGKPSYNFGEKSLDNLLLQQSGGIGKTSRDLQTAASDLKATGNDRALELGNLASSRLGQVDESRKYAHSAIGVDDTGQVIQGDGAGAIGKEYAEVNDNLAKANADRQAQLNAIQTALGRGVLDPDQLQAFGLASGQKLYDLHLNDYLMKGLDLTKDQTMTPAERARIQALSQLAGIDDTFANGTAQGQDPAYTFETDRFLNDAQGRQATIDREMKEIKNDIMGKVGQGTAGWPDENSSPKAWEFFYTNLINRLPQNVSESIKAQIQPELDRYKALQAIQNGPSLMQSTSGRAGPQVRPR
jgi:hypothetical protein